MGKPARDEVIEILRASGPLRIKDLYQKTQLSSSPSALAFDVNKLKNEGQVVLLDGNLWAIASQKPATPDDDGAEARWLEDGGRPADEAAPARSALSIAEEVKQTIQSVASEAAPVNAAPDNPPHPEPVIEQPQFRCALASDHSLLIQDGETRLDLVPAKTRILIDYLDRVLIDRQRRPWYACLLGRNGGAS